jgi:hypothetical protein
MSTEGRNKTPAARLIIPPPISFRSVPASPSHSTIAPLVLAGKERSRRSRKRNNRPASAATGPRSPCTDGRRCMRRSASFRSADAHRLDRSVRSREGSQLPLRSTLAGNPASLTALANASGVVFPGSKVIAPTAAAALVRSAQRGEVLEGNASTGASYPGSVAPRTTGVGCRVRC